VLVRELMRPWPVVPQPVAARAWGLQRASDQLRVVDVLGTTLMAETGLWTKAAMVGSSSMASASELKRTSGQAWTQPLRVR
jgi:hypothetical protein